ncbi:MAG: hypothetical protein ING30_10560, partial [Burkholderiales bacterium]|nr:hypothetical protein [Burkholderiales bacterium]
MLASSVVERFDVVEVRGLPRPTSSKESLLSAIHDLIAQVNDPRLRERLAAEWASASKEKKFGLVFEDHLPELLPLYKARPRRGDLVCRRDGSLKDVWQVQQVKDGMATCIKPGDAAQASPARAPEHGVAPEPVRWAVDELLVVRQFGEPIFPSLVPVDAVANGPAEAPWHTLIEADNYHALQLLEYLYAGQVDCIYIDPPYNTGARDWKYNNDYVDGNDGWRHSKWLAFMERRLRLAKRLLKPNSGVLIVTIDEHEVHHLGVLLEQVFPEYLRHVVSIVINPKGTGKLNFARVDEYAIFCVPNLGKKSVICPEPGAGAVANEELTTDEDSEDFENDGSEEEEVEPDELEQVDPEASAEPFPIEEADEWELRHARRRGGESSYRHQRQNQFYPIFVDRLSKKVVRAGQSIPLDTEPSFSEVDGLTPVWPIDGEGNHRCWRYIPSSMQSLIDARRVVLGRYNEARDTWTINYWVRKSTSKKLKTVWWNTLHDAGTHGTTFLQKVLGKRNAFPFPKSIYAVRDCIGAATRDRPNALIVDFFDGSGTTLNAVHLLNLNDGGSRRCIQITNNEVGEKTAAKLAARGIQPGSDEWERLGICRAVTWPRSKCTTIGHRADQAALKGEYLTGRRIQREKARSVTQIGFVDSAGIPPGPDASSKQLRAAIKLRKQLVALIDGLPQTLVQDPCAFIVSEDHKASVLFDAAEAEAWLEALDGQEHVTDIYIVTPVKRVFDQLKAQVAELLGPLLVTEEEKRPMSAGFAANLAYFKLDFLDPERVSLRRAFREILPLLWLKAGAVGPRPELKRGEPEPALFAPDGSNFVVLLDETRMGRLLKALGGRAGLSHVFIVTDADESFKSMAQ